MKKAGKQSLLVRYLTANLSLAMIACAVVGFILFSFAIDRMNKNYEQEMLNRLTLAAQDLERQEKILRDDSMSIRFDTVYRPSWFKRDATYEIDLVEDLKKYQGTSPLIQDFFLLYRDSDTVYIPGYKMAFSLYMKKRGVTEELERLHQRLVQVQESELLVHTDGSVFFCYNLPITRQNAPGDAVLAFCLDRDILRKRLETVMGDSAEGMYVYYENALISGASGPSLSGLSFENGRCLEKDCLAAQSEDGKFTVLAAQVQNASYAVLAEFKTACLAVFGVFSFVMVALACWTAWRNWRPIGKLTRLYAPNEHGNKNELEQINRLISSNMQSREQAQEALMQKMEELESQRLRVRRQLLLLLLSGNWDIPQQETQESGCLPLPLPCFGLLALRLRPGTDENALCRMIEELSDADMLFYATPLPDTRCLVVLVNLEERAGLGQAEDMIGDLREAGGFDLLPGEACDQPGELSSALVRVFTQNPENPQAMRHEIGCDQAIGEIVACIRQGEGAEAMTRLERLLLSLPGAYPSLMIRRYLYAGIIGTLLEAGRQAGMPSENEERMPSLLTAKEQDLRQATLKAAQAICAWQEKQQEPDDGKEMADQAALDYIEKNALNWNLTLESAAEAVGVSSRQISRILRRRKNTTYKEYVTALRMETAKRLLAEENLSVSEVSERVCYASVSYFIKTFRQYAGMTPANYKILLKNGLGADAEESEEKTR